MKNGTAPGPTKDKRPSLAVSLDPSLSSSKPDGESLPKKRMVVDETIRTIEISGLKSYRQAQTRPAKIFWLVLLIAATLILIWQLYKTIHNYINSPIVSTYTITTVPEMPFPVVYLCPTVLTYSAFLNLTPRAEQDALNLKENMGTVWDYVKFLSSGNLSEGFRVENLDRRSQVVPTAFQNMTRVVRRNDSDHSSNTSSSYSSSIDPEQFFKNASVPLDSHVRHCEFRSFLFETLPCENITTEVLDPEYGKCYLIDVGARKQAVQSQGLLVVFNMQSGNSGPQAKFAFPKDSPLTPIFNGVIVGIEREYNVRGSGEKVFVSPGTYNRIDLALQRQEFKSFDHPYKQKCTMDTKNGGDFEYKIFNGNYTQQSCGYDCVARELKDRCRCLPPIDRRLIRPDVLNETNRFCLGQEDLTCIHDRVHRDRAAVARIEQCRDQCHVPCVDWRYDVRATYMDLYKPAFASYQYVPDITYLLVAYSHMEYTQFTQDDSVTPDEMIANIGGEVGLWLGASMMTLIQLPLSLITFCGFCCVTRTKKAAVTVRDARERRKSMMPT